MSRKWKKPGDQLKEFADALKKDNLDDHGNLTVEYKNGELTINGKKQPEEVLKKYQSFLDTKKDFNFSIQINEK